MNDDVVATGGKETKVSSSGQRKKTLGKFLIFDKDLCSREHHRDARVLVV